MASVSFERLIPPPPPPPVYSFTLVLSGNEMRILTALLGSTVVNNSLVEGVNLSTLYGVMAGALDRAHIVPMSTCELTMAGVRTTLKSG